MIPMAAAMSNAIPLRLDFPVGFGPMAVLVALLLVGAVVILYDTVAWRRRARSASTPAARVRLVHSQPSTGGRLSVAEAATARLPVHGTPHEPKDATTNAASPASAAAGGRRA